MLARMFCDHKALAAASIMALASLVGLATRGSTAASIHPTSMHPAADPSASAARHASRLHESPYVWENGPKSGPDGFPIGVWLQTPANAEAYREIGINLFIGLWQGPTEAQLSELAVARMPVMAAQNAFALTQLDSRVLQGWTQQDEPDNAQSDGQGGWGPCVPPAEIQARYESMKARDPSRPVFLNLGQGVAWDRDDPYPGRGSACAGRWDHYPDYVQAADIVSFDIYPVTSRYEQIQGQLWRVAEGVKRLVDWTQGEKIVWNFIETTRIQSQTRPSPSQVRTEVWMSLIHGSQGILYFAHEWEPTFREARLLEDAEMRAVVKAINAEVISLAPALNAPAIALPEVGSRNPAVPVAARASRHDGSIYVFAVAMRDEATEAAFMLPAVGCGGKNGASVEVIGEGRSLTVLDGTFVDAFEGYGVHLYRVDDGGACAYLPRLAGR